MKLIERLSDYIEEEIEDAEKYIECSLKWKDDNPMLAKTFYDLSVSETNHISLLHDEVVRAINEYRSEHGDVPEKMQNLYDYIHEKHIEDVNKVKLMQMQYKNP